MASLFHSVGKYRKVWITTLMVLSMLTFVLCAGNKSDLTDTILRWFRPRGDSVASVGGTSLYREDIDRLKAQRAAANAYMKSLSAQLIEYVNDRFKNLQADKLEEDQQKRLGAIKYRQQQLVRRYNDLNFYGSGTKTDEIIDFRTWLAEADRLGVFLSDDELRKLVALDIFRYEILNNFPNAGSVDVQMQRVAEQKVRENSPSVNVAPLIRKGLMDEYRVRIAKLAAVELQLSTYDRNQFKRVKPAPHMPSELTRLSLTPAQLFEFYNDNRTEVDVALLEIPVEKYFDQVGEPDAKVLESLFNKHKGDPYNPASADPGFRNQQLMKIKWVTGDPGSPFFKNLARVSNDLAAWPVGTLSPLPLTDAVRFAAGQAILDTRVANEFHLGNQPLLMALMPNEPVIAGDLSDNLIATMGSYMATRDPAAIAALFGASARPDNILASLPLFAIDGEVKNRTVIKQALRDETIRRAPIIASLVASGAAGPLAPLPTISLHRRNWAMAPVPLVREPIMALLERQQTSPLVTANILFLKELMEKERVNGDELQMKRLLERFGPDFATAWEGREKNRNLGLEVHETKKLFGRYDVDSNEELKSLREAYDKYWSQINVIEGRDGVAGKAPLKEGDFAKVFFDGTEPTGLGGAPRHSARPWPPTLTLGAPTQLDLMMQNNEMGLAGMDMGAMNEFNRIKMDREANRVTTFNMLAHAEKPILMWKTEEQKDDPPKSLADVKDRVVQAWKTIQARDKALPAAQKIAENLLKGSADYRFAMTFAGKDIGAKVVEVNNVAKLASHSQNMFMGGGDYGPFQLKGQIKYPREDTVQELLSLNGLKEPIKIGVADIDNINAALFQEAVNAKRGPSKFVQILTNQPRDRFYVAVIDGTPRPIGQSDFARMLRMGGQAGPGRDTLLDRAQVIRGEEFYKTYLETLRKRFNVVMPKDKENDPGA